MISYNPGYQSAVKDLKESTKQRFVGIDFGYPSAPVEAEIVARESGVMRHWRRPWWRLGSGRETCAGRGWRRVPRPVCSSTPAA